MRSPLQRWLWRIAQWFHHVDFAWGLPFAAKLPLRLAYRLSSWRGTLNARTGRDWRSMALGFRHVQRQCVQGYEMLPIEHSATQTLDWQRGRFKAEARDEFEARWIAAGRVAELFCEFSPEGAFAHCSQRNRGLVLLTPHFESFFLGVAFLGRSGEVVNLMSSAVTKDPRVDAAVQAHFESKYRGLEKYLNGGKVVDMEDGLRPFYDMLARKEILVILGDAPVLPQGAGMDVNFLGGRRRIAGGAVRMAKKMQCDIGGFVCLPTSAGRYVLRLCTSGSANESSNIELIYDFFSSEILNNPGGWWASDLLPAMPIQENV